MRPRITFHMYGQTNNHVIQLANMLWSSRQKRQNLIVPPRLRWIPTLFDIDALHHDYCFSFQASVSMSVTASASFSMPGLNATSKLEIAKIVAALFQRPLPVMRKLLKPWCSITSAIHLRNMDGECKDRVQKYQPRDGYHVCHMSNAYIKSKLGTCSTDRVFLATDNQRPMDTKRIQNAFNASRYTGNHAIIVDLLLLAYAQKMHCAVLNPLSSFTRNAHAISTNAFEWCT